MIYVRDDSKDSWEEYIKYLHKWADDHKSKEFERMSPYSYEEYCNSDSEFEDSDNWVCSECGEETDTIQTIGEWCEELGYENELDLIYNTADRLNIFNTDICKSCFESILYSAGLI